MAQSNEVVDPVVVHIDDKMRKRALVAASIGNFSEWYEFSLYGFFAVIISQQIFDPGGGTMSLLATYAAFAISFFFRPIGGLIAGWIGDRHGRRNILATVLIATGAATFLIALIPPFASIGWWAPAFLLLLRVIQGLCLGGEMGGAMTMLAEFAPPGRRGFYTSFIGIGADLGMFAGAAFALVLGLVMPAEALMSWGWRIPFILALPLAVVGLIIRLKVSETPEFLAAKKATEERAENGITETPADTMATRRVFVRAFQLVFLLVGWTVNTYMITTFMPAYLATSHGVQSQTATAMVLSGLVIAIIVTPYFANLGDRVGRRTMIIWTAIAMVVLAIPLAFLLGAGVIGGFLGLMIMGLGLGAFNGSIPGAVTEMFPTAVRFRAIGVTYQLSVAIFGATTPLVLTWLTSLTRDNFAPGLYLAAACLLTTVAAFFLKPNNEVIRD